MAQPLKPQVIRIALVGKDKAPLSKAQQEFNRLTEEISALEQELVEFRTMATNLEQRIRAEYEPLLRQYNQLQAALVRVFDRAHARPDTTKAEKRKLAELIVELAYSLIRDYGMDDLKPIYDAYDPDGLENAIDQQEPVENPQDQTEQTGSQAEEESTQRSRTRTAKSAKKQEREARKLAEQRNITKAVRTLYMDLVKTFHPDREPDEAEKIRKTEIMQRVTEAYETSDLLALLRLQLEFSRIDQQHLEKLADDQLRYYNKILKQQANELSDELRKRQSQLAVRFGKSVPTTTGSVSALEFEFNNEIRTLKKRVKTFRQEVKDLSDPDILKTWLKAYRW